MRRTLRRGKTNIDTSLFLRPQKNNLGTPYENPFFSAFALINIVLEAAMVHDFGHDPTPVQRSPGGRAWHIPADYVKIFAQVKPKRYAESQHRHHRRRLVGEYVQIQSCGVGDGDLGPGNRRVLQRPGPKR